MTLGLADVSHMSIFNDFYETDRDEFDGRIIDQFTMITVDSAPADNHESTLGTGTNDLGNDTRAHTTLYSGQVEGAVDYLAIPLILVTLLPTLVILIVTIYPVLRMYYFLIVTISPVLRMNYFLIVTQRRVLRTKLILIVTLVCLRMNLSE